MPTSSGAKPHPASWPPLPVAGQYEPPPAGARGGAGCGVPSKGSSSCVPAVEGSVRAPVKLPKASAAVLVTLATALAVASPMPVGR